MKYLLTLFVLLLGAAQAHWSDLSAAEVQLEPHRASLTLTFPTRLVQAFDDDKNGILSPKEVQSHNAALEQFFAEQILVSSNGKNAPLKVTGTSLQKSLGGQASTHSTVLLEYTLQDVRDIRLVYNLFVPGVSTASCVATILYNSEVREFVFRPENREFRLEAANVVDFFAFIGLGVQHILTGYDHLLFVLTLLMLGAGLPYLLKVITAFTLAHSISLSLAAFGVLNLPSKWVESGIALTIAYVAAENLLHKNPSALSRSRWGLTFFFGLIHGLGFAGVLEEIGLPRDHAVLSLFGFNLGVELGQLAVVIPVSLLLAWLKRISWEARLRQTISGLAVLAGLLWFVQRVFS